METTKKTSTTRAALLVVAALSMLLSGLFIATASRSDASPASACPDGFSLTADAKNCFQAATVSSSDNANSCDVGELTADASQCYVAAQVMPQPGVAVCPTGYSQDDSLGGMCARFVDATLGAETCPAGSSGVADACYILVAMGPAGAGTCAGDTVLEGNVCVEDEDAPTQALSCPTSDTVIEIEDDADTADEDESECFSVVLVPENDCIVANGYYFDDETEECRDAQPLSLGDLTCEDGILIGTDCKTYTDPEVAGASCPIGSYLDASGDCRKPVANAVGTYSCADAASALNGKTCVFTTGFSVTLTADMYKCAEGARAVIGTDVICILGASTANTTSGVSCLQGVLSTDSAYCIVPRSDAAPAAVAPVPSFTG